MFPKSNLPKISRIWNWNFEVTVFNECFEFYNTFSCLEKTLEAIVDALAETESELDNCCLKGLG